MMTKEKSSPVDQNPEVLIGLHQKDLNSGETGLGAGALVKCVVPPDGGWGWMVVFSSFLIHVIADGIVYSFGVFMMEFVVYFKAGRGAASWIGALQPAVTFTVGPLASVLTKRYGCRIVTIAGAIIAASGFIGSAWAPDLYYLYFTSGVMAGVGFGFIYLPAIVCVAQYFEKKRSLATGLAVCGSGFGTFILAPLTGLLVHKFSWQGAMLILGCVILNVVICGVVFRPLKADVMSPRKASPESEVGALLSDVEFDESLSQRDRTISSMKNGADSEENKSLNLDEFSLDIEIDDRETMRQTRRNNFSIIRSPHQINSLNSGVVVLGKGPKSSNRNKQQLSTNNNTNGLEGQSSEQSATDGNRHTKWREDSNITAEDHTRLQSVGNSFPTSNRQHTADGPLNTALSESQNTHLPISQPQNRHLLVFQPQNRCITIYESQDIQTSISESQGSPLPSSKPTNSARYVSIPIVLHVQSDSALLSPSAGKSILRASASTPRYKAYTSYETSSHNSFSSPITSPLSRKDIFYTGSLKNIPMYRSQPEIYKATMIVRSDQDAEHLAETEDRKHRECFNFSREFRSTMKEMLSLSLLKNPVFLMFAFSNFFTSLGFNMPFIFLPDRAKLAGIDEHSASLLLSVIGIANTAGRIFFGFLSDRPWVNRLMLYNAALTICGVVTALSPLVGGDYLLLVTYAAVFGVFIGVYVSLTSVVLVDLLGLHYLTNSFGLLLLFQGAATFVGPPVAGLLFDLTGSYDISFLLMGSLVALSGVMLYFLPLIQRYSARGLSREHTVRDLELGRKPVTGEHMEMADP